MRLCLIALCSCAQIPRGPGIDVFIYNVFNFGKTDRLGFGSIATRIAGRLRRSLLFPRFNRPIQPNKFVSNLLNLLDVKNLVAALPSKPVTATIANHKIFADSWVRNASIMLGHRNMISTRNFPTFAPKFLQELNIILSWRLVTGSCSFAFHAILPSHHAKRPRLDW